MMNKVLYFCVLCAFLLACRMEPEGDAAATGKCFETIMNWKPGGKNDSNADDKWLGRIQGNKK